MPQTVESYVDSNHDRILEELCDFIRIPSISTSPEHEIDVKKAAEFTAESLKKAGLENVEIIPTARHPLVYGECLKAPGAPTVLCYGHYDVQPPDPLEEWTSPPFEPTIRDGSLYARGAADDKGQFYTHVKAVEALQAARGALPLNVKFLIEGEEEVGGASIAKFVPENKEKLRADVALVSDTAMYAEGYPTLCTGLRGLVYMEVDAIGPSRDLHSGLYGGAVPNAVYGLVELLSKVKDANGVIQIPGIYDDVVAPSPAETESWANLPFNEDEFLKHEVGSSSLSGEPDQTVLARVWARPTFEVHGIAGGFTAEGAKTVIPAKATAKVSLRLVPNQDADKVIAAFRRFVSDNTPRGIQTEVRVSAASLAVLVDTDHPAIREAAKAFGDTFQRTTVYIRSGGSVPIVGDFAEHLGIPTVMMGLGLPDDGLHSPNEKFSLNSFFTGIKTVARFMTLYGGSR